MSELIASERGCWGEMSPIVNCLVQGGEGLERRETATAYSSHRHSNNPIRSTPKKRAQLVQKFVVELRKSPRCSKFFSPASRQKDLTILRLDTVSKFRTECVSGVGFFEVGLTFFKITFLKIFQ